jgi:hypothetical protein
MLFFKNPYIYIYIFITSLFIYGYKLKLKLTFLTLVLIINKLEKNNWHKIRNEMSVIDIKKGDYRDSPP